MGVFLLQLVAEQRWLLPRRVEVGLAVLVHALGRGLLLEVLGLLLRRDRREDVERLRRPPQPLLAFVEVAVDESEVVLQLFVFLEESISLCFEGSELALYFPHLRGVVGLRHWVACCTARELLGGRVVLAFVFGGVQAGLTVLQQSVGFLQLSDLFAQRLRLFFQLLSRLLNERGMVVLELQMQTLKFFELRRQPVYFAVFESSGVFESAKPHDFVLEQPALAEEVCVDLAVRHFAARPFVLELVQLGSQILHVFDEPVFLFVQPRLFESPSTLGLRLGPSGPVRLVLHCCQLFSGLPQLLFGLFALPFAQVQLRLQAPDFRTPRFSLFGEFGLVFLFPGC